MKNQTPPPSQQAPGKDGLLPMTPERIESLRDAAIEYGQLGLPAVRELLDEIQRLQEQLEGCSLKHIPYGLASCGCFRDRPHSQPSSEAVGKAIEALEFYAPKCSSGGNAGCNKVPKYCSNNQSIHHAMCEDHAYALAPLIDHKKHPALLALAALAALKSPTSPDESGVRKRIEALQREVTAWRNWKSKLYQGNEPFFTYSSAADFEIMGSMTVTNHIKALQPLTAKTGGES